MRRRRLLKLGGPDARTAICCGLAQEQFDVFITVDRNLSFPQDADQFDIAVVVLTACSNAIEDLEPLMPAVVRALSDLRRGEVLRVGA